MEPPVPASAPEPYREPRTGFGALVRNRIVRRITLCVVVLGLVAALDQSIVRTEGSPSCLVCCAGFDTTHWRLDVPLLGVTTEIRTLRVPRSSSRAADLLGPGHEHQLQSGSTRETRGILVERPCGGICCGLPSVVTGRFAGAIVQHAAFADFVQAAIDRGDVPREDVVAAIEMLEHLFDRGEPTPEERRLRDVANTLYAAWLGKPVAETDLWNERR